VEFVQRDSYRETMDLLRLEKLDFAWICDYPYLHLKQEVRLLAVPLYQGRPHYRSYLIVRKDDTKRQLDEVTCQGQPCLPMPTRIRTPATWRRVTKSSAVGRTTPRISFKRTFFTWSHRKVPWRPWPAGLAQGARGGQLYLGNSLAIVEPALPARTRVVWRSPEYGFPPFVSHRSVSRGDFETMQQHLLGMAQTPAGQRLLGRLHLDGFTAGTPGAV
jgi:phosphonate transport system substrate-binding protein